MIDLFQALGMAIAVSGSVFGLVGAWATAENDQKVRHFGFTCWVINSPLLTISMFGIAMGVWTGFSAWAFVPLYTIYWYTAIRGWINTR